MLYRIVQLPVGVPNLNAEEHPPKMTLARAAQQWLKEYSKAQGFKDDEAVVAAVQEFLAYEISGSPLPPPLPHFPTLITLPIHDILLLSKRLETHWWLF
ncbi:hypothetical protein EVAR_47906_1 [Eumeta japonica]|uniref:Uncharacterized protein n=1 Tax=Eumeta variegata TaxID=151549 RepID=A0A4C1YAA2_EUMVA|nr:hypothetical protein EVAR_47906_1 [Eumeta japonica]